MYRPPPSATNNLSVTLFLTEFFQFLEQLVITTTSLVIVGDLNFHVNDLQDTTAKRFLWAPSERLWSNSYQWPYA